MGEFALYQGDRIKIGTCEEMYYLRFDQRLRVRAVEGSVDPVGDELSIRFRFPFPDEDHVEPGHFDDYDRGLPVPGYRVPEDWLGEDEKADDDKPVEIVQQKIVAEDDGQSRQLWTVVRVPLVDSHSGKLFRLPLGEAAKVAETLADHASDLLAQGLTDESIDATVGFLIRSAARVLEGYRPRVTIVDELAAKS